MAGGPRPAGIAQLCRGRIKGVAHLYVELQRGTRVERRLRQANLCMIRMARAWDAVFRLYPSVVPLNNPFKGLEHGKGTERPASRAESLRIASRAHRGRRTSPHRGAADLFRAAPAPRERARRSLDLDRLPAR